MLAIVYAIHTTKKLRDRLPTAPGPDDSEASNTVLGPWYATVISWRPEVALFVNETTLLPVLLPLAPIASLTKRFPPALALVLAAHGVSTTVVDQELAQMHQARVMATNNRSVVGIMTEFSFLADAVGTPRPDLMDTALWLARTPCSPLYHRHTSPDRELKALLAQQNGG